MFQNLSAPFTWSTLHGPSLALLILTTIFNTLSLTSSTRYHLVNTIISLVRGSASFEFPQPQLKNLDAWIAQWEIGEEEQRQLYVGVADIAEEEGHIEKSYVYLLRALCTTSVDETDSSETRTISTRVLKAVFSHPSHFDFQDLAAVVSIQAPRKSDPTYFELLEVFNADLLDDFNDFKDEHDTWLKW